MDRVELWSNPVDPPNDPHPTNVSVIPLLYSGEAPRRGSRSRRVSSRVLESTEKGTGRSQRTGAGTGGSLMLTGTIEETVSGAVQDGEVIQSYMPNE